jgi:CRISPR/Cas system-associated exonuclease Cas4 (RecB family)
MGVVLATKTLLAIERALRSDQGATFRSLLRENINACDDAFNGEQDDGYRSHLGASLIGRDCPRQLWYAFRWVHLTKHVGKTLLLFNRGHMEEGRFVSLLQMIGMKVWQVDPKTQKQYRVSYFGGHYGSAIDGVAINCPDVPGEPIITEFKTSNSKNFAKMQKEGVRESKPEHYIQMQVYMKSYKLRKALYLVVNKETDELYGEIVSAESAVADQYQDRAENIIFRDTPPKGISNTPGAWSCKFCDFKEVCHNDGEILRNCRTCVFAQAKPDGTWSCRNFNIELTKEMQKWANRPCEAYEKFREV